MIVNVHSLRRSPYKIGVREHFILTKKLAIAFNKMTRESHHVHHFVLDSRLETIAT